MSMFTGMYYQESGMFSRKVVCFFSMECSAYIPGVNPHGAPKSAWTRALFSRRTNTNRRKTRPTGKHCMLPAALFRQV